MYHYITYDLCNHVISVMYHVIWCHMCHLIHITGIISYVSCHIDHINHFCTKNWGQLKQKSPKCHFHFSVKYSGRRNFQRQVFCNAVKPRNVSKFLESVSDPRCCFHDVFWLCPMQNPSGLTKRTDTVIILQNPRGESQAAAHTRGVFLLRRYEYTCQFLKTLQKYFQGKKNIQEYFL